VSVAHCIVRAALAWLGVVLLSCTTRTKLPDPVPPFTRTPSEAFRARPPVLEPGGDLVVPEQRVLTLENGLRVIVVERHDLPVAALAFANRAARDADVPALVGLAALTVRTLDGGTVFENGEILTQLTIDGRRLRLGTTREGTAIQIETLPWGVDEALAVLARWVRFPALSETALDDALSAQLDEIRMHENSLIMHLHRAALERLYGPGHALTLPTVGTQRNLARLKLADVKAFHGRTFRPGASAIVAVGDVDANRVHELVRAHFGTWSAASIPVVSESAPGVRRRKMEVSAVVHGPQQAAVVALYPCPGHADPDALAGDLLAVVLGQMTLSRTAVRLRHEAGASYAGSAQCLQRRNFGELTIVLTSDSERVGFTLETILEQVESLKTELVSAQELETAKSRVLALYTGRIASTPALAGVLASHFVSGIPDDFFPTLTERVRALNAERLRDVAAHYFTGDRFAVAVGGDPLLLNHQLNNFGEVQWSRLEERSK
jgi:zinc protease